MWTGTVGNRSYAAGHNSKIEGDRRILFRKVEEMVALLSLREVVLDWNQLFRIPSGSFQNSAF
jgi:hypothetical protein